MLFLKKTHRDAHSGAAGDDDVFAAEDVELGALTSPPRGGEGRAGEGDAFFADDGGDPVERRLRDLIERHPARAEAHYNLGILLRLRGDAAGAEASYTRAIELKPDYAPAMCNLGTLLGKQGRADPTGATLVKAEAYLRRAHECGARQALAAAKAAENPRGERAADAWWGAARIYPYNLGVVLEMKASLNGGDAASLEEAKKYFREALYLDPTYSSAQQSLTALEAPEARAAEQPSPLLVLQSNAGMLAGLKQLGLVPEHGAATLRNLHRAGLDRLSIQQLAEVGLSRGPRRGRRGRGRSSGPLSLSPLPSQVGLESLNAEIRADRTGFEDLLCSN